VFRNAQFEAACQIVREDLMQFCHANETPYHPDVNKTHILIGRLEVWHRIANYLNLSPETLFEQANRIPLKDVKNG
jgi:hypothetical protein